MEDKIVWMNMEKIVENYPNNILITSHMEEDSGKYGGYVHTLKDDDPDELVLHLQGCYDTEEEAKKYIHEELVTKPIEKLRRAAAQLDAETLEFLLRSGARIMDQNTELDTKYDVCRNEINPIKNILTDGVDFDIEREIQWILRSKSEHRICFNQS